jgi:hypothetical protein
MISFCTREYWSLINRFYLLDSSQLTRSINWPAIALSMFMLSFIFVVFLSGSVYVQGFTYRSFTYVLPLEIQLSRGGWDPINRFNTATCLCLSQDRTWISNVMSLSPFCVQGVKVRGRCLFCWYWWNLWPSNV